VGRKKAEKGLHHIGYLEKNGKDRAWSKGAGVERGGGVTNKKQNGAEQMGNLA